MTRRNLDRLDKWPVIRQAEPFRWTWRDELRNALSILGQAAVVLLVFAAVFILVLWMGAVVEGVPA